MFAIRARRKAINEKDLLEAIEKVNFLECTHKIILLGH